MTTTRLNYENAPGHQVLAAAGKTVLRPGGRAATEQLFTWANFQPGETVLELAASFGESAIAMSKRFGVHVVGVEKNPDSVLKARANIKAAGLEDKVEMIEGDILHLNQIDRQFDYVFAEAILTMQSRIGKEKIARSLQEKLKPGGQLLSQEMFTRGDEDKLNKILANAIRVNSQPLSLENWTKLWQNSGLEVEKSTTGSFKMLSLPQLIDDEGLGGTLRIIRNVFTNSQLRARVLQMRKTFLEHQEELGYVVICARLN